MAVTMPASILVPELDNAVTGSEAFLYTEPQAVDRCQERRSPAVSETDPHKTGFCFRLAGKVEEVLVLADDDALALTGISPDLRIGCLCQTNIQDMLTIKAARDKKARERNGKLVVDEELHEAWSTAWSARRAAYSIAARMSSLSRNG